MCIDLLGYWSSLKNVLQLFTYTTSIYISIVLLSGTLCHHKEILWLSPVTLLFGYVAVLFCLEKTKGIGIYIVAFKGTILKSFYLTPIIFILFMSFIISFKASKINENENFANATVSESVAKLTSMFLSNIDSIEKLGMQSENSGSNYVLFLLFVILVPILLINLMIGVALGELKEVLDKSKTIQFEMRIKYTLTVQKIFHRIFGSRCESYFIFNEIQDDSLKKHSIFKNKINKTEKSEFKLEECLLDLKNDIKKENKSLRLYLNKILKEKYRRIEELEGKIEVKQLEYLERLNRVEKRIERNINEKERKTNKKLDAISNDLLSKSY